VSGSRVHLHQVVPKSLATRYRDGQRRRPSAPDPKEPTMSTLGEVHLVFLGFNEEMVARHILELVKEAKDAKAIAVADWALVHKEPGGKVTIEGDKSVDPGAARGALFGGGVGMVLAAMTGPVGMAAVAAGAAIGAITAGVHDSGMKTKDLEAASRLMADGRTGLVFAIPAADVDAWHDFVSRTVEFEAPDRTYEVDITPTNTFADAVAEYGRDAES
jgi:uncharacterized membrane protein